MKVYAKDSIDRLGDDLTEEVLQYLTLEDKIRLECVSKQWMRCLFNKQFVIEIVDNKTHNSLNKLLDNRRQLNEQHLESVLKKFPNIKKVNFICKIDSSVLSLIGRYCPRIKSLSYEYSNEDKSLNFFRTYGHKLEELNLREPNEDVIEILKLCPNVKKIKINIWTSSTPVLCMKDQEFLPKLDKIETLFMVSSENLKILSDK